MDPITARLFDTGITLGCMSVAIFFLVRWVRHLEEQRDAREAQAATLCQSHLTNAITRIQQLEQQNSTENRQTITACHQAIGEYAKAQPILAHALNRLAEKVSIVVICALLIAGCGEGARIADAIPVVPAAPVVMSKMSIMSLPPPAKDAAQAKEQAAEARAQMSFWTARLEVAEAEGKRLATEEKQRWLETICRWAIGLCFVGLLGNVALFAASFIWPWFARLRLVALGGAGAALALIVVLWCLPAALHWAGPLVGVAALVGLAAVVWHLHTLGKESPHGR